MRRQPVTVGIAATINPVTRDETQTPQPFNPMKPLQYLRAWWRARRVVLVTHPPADRRCLAFGFELWRLRGMPPSKADPLGVPAGHSLRTRSIQVVLHAWHGLTLQWDVGPEPEPLTSAQVQFRRTRRLNRRFIVGALLLACAIIAWATWGAVRWYDGRTSNLMAGLQTGGACVALLFCAATIADAVDDIRRTRDRERVTVPPQTPAR